jgi:hypothetical protein
MRNLPAIAFSVAILVIAAAAVWYVWHRNGVDDREEIATTAFQKLTIDRMDKIDEVHRKGLEHLNAIDQHTATTDRMMAQLLQLYCTSDGILRCKPDGTPK